MIRDLAFAIRGRDQSGPAFDSVKRKLGEVEGAARSVSERVSGAAKAVRNVGLAASAAVTAPLTLLAKQSLELFDIQAKAEAQIRKAVETTGGAAGFAAEELFRMASGLQEITRFGDEEILANVTGQLLTFTNIAGEEFRRAQATALDVATVLQTDTKSAAIQLGKALNDPIRGLGALAEAGVQFTESQKEVVRGLVETGDIAAAQRLILDELAIQFGGQAQAAAEAGLGPIQQLANSFGDLKEEIGRNLLPLLKPVIDVLRDVVAGFIALPEPVKQFSVVLGVAAAAIGPVLAAAGLLVAGLAALSAPVLAAGAAIVTLGAIFVTFGDDIGRAAAAVRDGLLAGIEGAVGAIRDLSEAAVAALGDMVERIREAVIGRLAAVWDGVIGQIDRVKAGFFDLYDAVVGNSYVPDMVDGIAAEFGRLPSVMVAPADRAVGAVSGAFDGLAGEVSGSLTDMARDGAITFSNFGDTLVSIGQRFADRLLNVAFAPLESGLNSILSGLVGGGPAGGGGGGLLGGFLGTLFNAKGNAFAGGRVTALAKGGIVSGATAFPLRGGIGIMGEAGPEAVMPLRRTRDGSLGVIAEGGGGMVINVDARGASDPAAIRAAVNLAISEALGRVPAVNRDMQRRGML